MKGVAYRLDVLRQVSALLVREGQPHERKQLRHVAKARAKFAIYGAWIVAENLFGIMPASPRHEKYEVSRRIPEHRVGPVDDTDEEAGRGIDEKMLGLQVHVNELHRTGGWWFSGLRLEPCDRAIDSGIQTFQLQSH